MKGKNHTKQATTPKQQTTVKRCREQKTRSSQRKKRDKERQGHAIQCRQNHSSKKQQPKKTACIKCRQKKASNTTAHQEHNPKQETDVAKHKQIQTMRLGRKTMK